MSSGSDHAPRADIRSPAAKGDGPIAHGFEELVDGVPETFVFYDQTGRITFANDEFRRRTGRSMSELLGKRPFEWDDGSFAERPDVERFRQHLDLTLATGEPTELVRVHTMPSGITEVYRVSFRAQHDQAGQIVGAFMFAQDISDLALARRDAAQRELEFQTLAENLPDILVRYDGEGRVTYVNDELEARTQGRSRSMLGRRPFQDDRSDVIGAEAYERCLDEVLATGESRQVELKQVVASGECRVYSVIMRAERDAEGAITGAFSIGRDVTALVRARQRADDNERRFRSLAENATDFIGRWDTEARRIYANPALARLIAGASQELNDCSRAGDFADLSAAIRTCLREAAPATVLQRYRDPNGDDVWVHEVRLVPEFDDDGSVVSVLGIGRDISEVVRHSEALERAARTDSLTGVASRQVLYERLPGTLQAATREHRRVALLIVDLDGFKHVNDQHGHRLGDRILRAVGRELSDCLAPHDFIVRLGGDEFVLVLTQVESPTDASLMAHQARLRLNDLDTGGDERFPKIDASIGIAMFPEDGNEVDALLAHADLALYDAKRSGRGRVEYFRPELRAAMERWSLIEQALHDCVPDTEMTLYLQPICTLGSDTHVWGAEALLRWNHPLLGPICPDEFIPIAEHSGQIVPIGRWVLRRAAELAVERNRHRSRPLRIAVNVSTRQFTLDDIGDAVRDALAVTGCEPGWIVVELTESLLLEGLPLVNRSLEALHRLGVAIAIDDFGTGYSSLHYLTRLRIDHMKIDKSFVRDADVDRQQQEIVRALVAMAHALGIEIVAEGIETKGQAELLRALGCGLGQGYLLAPPLPVDQFDRWLTTAATSLRGALPV